MIYSQKSSLNGSKDDLKLQKGVILNILWQELL